MISYGLDLAIKTGSLVQLTINSRGVVESARIISSWSRGPRLHKKANESDLVKICKELGDIVFPPLSGFVPGPVFIDWSISEIHWGNGKRTMTCKSFITGNFYNRFESLGFCPQAVSPSDVRKTIRSHVDEASHLKYRAPKEQVQRFFINRLLHPYSIKKNSEYPIDFASITDHDWDAFVLAYLAYFN